METVLIAGITLGGRMPYQTIRNSKEPRQLDHYTASLIESALFIKKNFSRACFAFPKLTALSNSEISLA
jgi:hypothetical protein